MRLTSEQRQAVQSLVSEYVVDVESPERAVKQALHAIVVGDANPVARMVTEAAGVEWITPVIWAREEVHMTEETAREIIAQALNDGTWETAAPEEADQAIKDAEGLVKMAEDAWEQNIRGPEVEAILRIAAADEGGEAAAPAAKPKPGAKKAPAKPAPKKPGPPKKPTLEPEPEADAPEMPWEGYDTNKVAEIIEGVEVWGEDLDENLGYLVNLYAYEQAHKNRKNIIAACEAVIPADSMPEAPAAEPEEETPAEPEAETEVPEEWASEPFETYDTLKVAEIKEALDEFFQNEEYTEEDKLNTLGHVSYYEGSNKARSGLIDYLEGIQQQYEEATADVNPEAAPEEEGAAEGAAAPGSDAPAASRPARSKGGSKATPAAAGEGDPGDGITYTVKATGLGAMEVSGPHGAAGCVTDMLESGATTVTVTVTNG